MAGYEQDYPEHYANVRARWDELRREYDQAVAEGDQNMSLPPDSVCIGGGKEDEPQYAKDPVGACPIAGEGDPVCLTDPDAEAIADQEAHEEWLKHVELSIVGPVEKFGTTAISADRDTVPPTTRTRFGIPESDASGSGVWTVSNRVAENFRRAVQRIHDAGARVSSGGGFRSLYAPVSLGRSAKSFHYSGLAIDLFPYSATLDAETDLLVVQRDGQDLTQIFEAEGFHRIRSQPGFRENPQWGMRLAMEWWHFESTDHLSEGSLFGKVLLELHSYEEARWSPPWSYYDARYKGGSFGY